MTSYDFNEAESPWINLNEDHFTQSWSAVYRLNSETSSDTLILLTPVEPLQDGRFQILRLTKSDAPEEISRRIQALKLSGANLEYVYMDFDECTGCKIISGIKIVTHPRDVSNVIVRTPTAAVDLVKRLWEARHR